ncbi:MAG: hypothetical protein HYT31_00440 [Parcubacteria group bacterium]|nr:hypothetical protein [Parcubacteria group bacterium]
MPNTEVTLEAIRRVVKDEIQPIRDEMREFKSEVLNREDRIMHELKAIREEQSATAHRDDEQDKEINHLKGRVTTIEQRVSI